MNRERLTAYEECLIIVALGKELEKKEKWIEETDLDWFAKHLKKDVKELTQIINKLK